MTGHEPAFEPCVANACASASAPGLTAPLPMVGHDDEEGARVDAGLPKVVDAHVHLFPDPVFSAIWRWFEEHGWPIRYKLRTPEVISFLLSRGVDHLVALHYAHKPGMARALNEYMAAVVRDEPRVTGLATVLPGEPGAKSVLEEGFRAGLAGVKLHCHVQCFSVDDDAMGELYEACVAHDKPMLVHAGREPKSQAYLCDPYEVCGAERVERVLRAYPGLRLVVPHLGADEWSAYERLLERHDNLWLDTTMMLADYFDTRGAQWRFFDVRPQRLLYGTDFPNLPYAWDRELRRLAARRLDDETLARVLGGTAREVFRIPG